MALVKQVQLAALLLLPEWRSSSTCPFHLRLPFTACWKFPEVSLISNPLSVKAENVYLDDFRLEEKFDTPVTNKSPKNNATHGLIQQF